MKILKRILIVVVILIAIPLIVAAFTKKEYVVEREVTINRPNSDVYEYIRLLRNQEHFNTWSMQDPAIKREYRGDDGTVGSAVSWQSEMMGKGEQEIVGLETNKSVRFKLRFIEPWEGLAESNLETEALTNETTKVKWDFKSAMPYPMNFMLLFANMDEMMGTELQKGLGNLKTQIEK